MSNEMMGIDLKVWFDAVRGMRIIGEIQLQQLKPGSAEHGNMVQALNEVRALEGALQKATQGDATH